MDLEERSGGAAQVWGVLSLLTKPKTKGSNSMDSRATWRVKQIEVEKHWVPQGKCLSPSLMHTHNQRMYFAEVPEEDLGQKP
jgi:hypothetical protein